MVLMKQNNTTMKPITNNMAQKTAMHQMLDELMAHEYTIPLELIVKCKELIELENEQLLSVYKSGLAGFMEDGIQKITITRIND